MPRNSTASKVSYEERRRRIVAWPGYTIDQFGRVYRVDEPLEIYAGPKGDFVMLGTITPGGRVSTDKTKRYISDLLRSTWPEIQEKDDVLLERWKGIPDFPSYEIDQDGTVRHVVTLRPLKIRTKPGQYACCISLFKPGERVARTVSVDKIYRALWGKPYPREVVNNT